jgi:hypothetical protein
MLFSRAHGGSNQLTATGAVNYEPPAGSEYGGPGGVWGTEATQQAKAPIEIELSGLQSLTYTNTLTTAATTLRVRNAGANGNQVVSVPAGSTTKVTDASNTDTIASGAFFCTTASVAASGSGLYVPGGARLVMQPTTDTTKHWALYGGYCGGSVAAGATVAGWSPTSYNSNDPVGDQYLAFALWYCDATIEVFDFYVGANTLSVATTFQLYVAGSAVSGATKTVTAGATGRFSLDGLGAVSLVSGDSVELRTTVPAGTGSISLYSVSMWIAGVQQAGMWHALNNDGSLTYTFMEVLVEMYPYWWIRAGGGVIYLAGIVVFIYNLVQTARSGKPATDAVAA